MKTVQITFAVLIGALVALFAIGNLTMIEVSFVGFTVATPLIVLILALIATGFLLGKMVRILPKRKHAAKDKGAAPLHGDAPPPGDPPNGAP